MFLRLLLILTTILAVNGCVLHKATNKEELCNATKRQQVFSAVNPGGAQMLAQHYQVTTALQ